eukprot:TRINITY_DN1561_c0_g1_i2.p2 TRINITY_DN1561_c0_g1~~TRINITY_DN1561_c0_g1_i2.p2  ORF type:complete len:162 (-),score=48.48 TRINITY_DN1561_c0_g1_i2:828-1313(-)
MSEDKPFRLYDDDDDYVEPEPTPHEPEWFTAVSSFMSPKNRWKTAPNGKDGLFEQGEDWTDCFIEFIDQGDDQWKWNAEETKHMTGPDCQPIILKSGKSGFVNPETWVAVQQTGWATKDDEEKNEITLEQPIEEQWVVDGSKASTSFGEFVIPDSFEVLKE